MKKLIILFLIAATLSISHAQQVADPNFDTKVAHPAYKKNGPKVLFDEAHKHSTLGPINKLGNLD